MKPVLLITDVGGPVALHTLLSEMPEDFPSPLVVLPSSESGLLESSAAALRRTTALTIEMLEPHTELRPSCVYFGLPNTYYKPIFKEGHLTVESGRMNKDEEYIARSIQLFTGVFDADLTVVWLSGRSRVNEIRAACSVLENSRANAMVLHRSETVVFDMGRQVLESCPCAKELGAAEICAAICTSSRIEKRGPKSTSTASGR